MTAPPRFPQTLFDEIILKSRRQRRRIETDIVHGQLSAIVSMLSGIAKLDGMILQRALVEAIKLHPDYEILWRPRIPITEGAEQVAATHDYETWLGPDADLPFGGPVRSMVEVDFIVINRITGNAIAYECKRGGACDSGKRSKIIDNLFRVKLVLAKYLVDLRNREPTKIQTEVKSADVRLIVYYGNWQLKPITTINRHTIDAHFGIPVTPLVSMAADLMRQEMTTNLLPFLEGLLNGLVAQSADPQTAPNRTDLAALLTRTLNMLQPVEGAV